MTTAPAPVPALEWPQVTSGTQDDPPSGQPPRRIGPMIRLKSDMDPGEPMHVQPGDYHDPERWWL